MKKNRTRDRQTQTYKETDDGTECFACDRVWYLGRSLDTRLIHDTRRGVLAPIARVHLTALSSEIFIDNNTML